MKRIALAGLVLLVVAGVGCEEQKRQSLHGQYMAPYRDPNQSVSGSGGWFEGTPTPITPSNANGSGYSEVGGVHEYASGREPVSSVGQPERESAAGVHH